MEIREIQTDEELAKVKNIRIHVFVEEQGIPLELEMDEKDGYSKFVIAIDQSGEVVGTGRITAIVENKLGMLSRIAVLPEFRGKGVGKKIIQKMEDICREHDLHILIVKPHQYLKDYYEQLGYNLTDSQNEQVAHHALIQMMKVME